MEVKRLIPYLAVVVLNASVLNNLINGFGLTGSAGTIANLFVLIFIGISTITAMKFYYTFS